MPRISQMTELATAEPTDMLPIYEASSGVTKKISVKNLTGLPDVGWTATGESWAYASWSSTTRIGTITVPTDATTKYTAGMRIRIAQSTGGTKYGIIHKVAATVLTVFFPSGTTLNNEAITSPVYSALDVPYGFNKDPLVWSLSITDTSDRSTTSTSWSNPGSVLLALGIGCWDLSYSCNLLVTRAATTFANGRSTLSAANNTEDDSSMSGQAYIGAPSGTLVLRISVYKQKDVNLAAATTYYLNLISTAASITVTAEGAVVASKINAVSRHL